MQTCLFPWCSSQRRSLNASREYSSQRRYSIGQSYDVIFQWFQYHWFKSYCQYKSLLSHEHYNDCVLYVFSAKQWLVLFQMIWCVGSVSSVAVRTWRVTMLIHPTAAFFFFFCSKLGHQLCGVMHDGSDAAVWLAASHWGRKRASWNAIGSYVIGATGRLLLSRGLSNTSGFDRQTGSQSKTETSYLFMGVGGISSEKERQVNDCVRLHVSHDGNLIYNMSHIIKTIPLPRKLA